MPDDHEARLLRMAGAKTPNGFLLYDAVRRDCPLSHDAFDYPCEVCKWRFWVPSTDPMVWAAALFQVWVNASLTIDRDGMSLDIPSLGEYMEAQGPVRLDTFLQVFEEGLVAAGVLKVESDLGTT